MIPDTIADALLSENAAIAASFEPRTANDTIRQRFTTNIALVRTFNNSMPNRYIQRIPSRSIQWENYLLDLVDARAKRTRRIQYAQESVNEFLQRFPIDESP